MKVGMTGICVFESDMAVRGSSIVLIHREHVSLSVQIASDAIAMDMSLPSVLCVRFWGMLAHAACRASSQLG